jgi:pimeloyl-ACP methyl ester carboxylesterase
LTVFLSILGGLVLLGAAYQVWGAWRDRRLHPMPGRLYEAAGCRLHAHVKPGPGPVVVFESGVAASSLNWTRIHQNVSSYASVLSYDRAGLGWSARSPRPRTVANMVDELHALLRAAGLRPPFVFVGHSFGGFLLRHYAAAHPADVAALVLVDPLTPAEWWPLSAEGRYKISRAVFLSRWGALLAALGVVRFALDLLVRGARALPKLIARAASSGRGADVTARLVGEVRKMPEEVWPMIKAHWCLPKNFLAMGDYLGALPLNCAQDADPAALAGKPLWVLSAAVVTPDRLAGHERVAASSPSAVHRHAASAGHWIHLDEPALVLDAIREAWQVGRALPPAK